MEMSGNKELSKEKSREEKLKDLFFKQKRTLDLFLERGAISQAQYDKSLGDLIRKMGMEKEYSLSGMKDGGI